jgi:hypothetical protein
MDSEKWVVVVVAVVAVVVVIGQWVMGIGQVGEVIGRIVISGRWWWVDTHPSGAACAHSADSIEALRYLKRSMGVVVQKDVTVKKIGC